MTTKKDLDLTLHIGLHKTASTYVQNVWSAGRERLLQAGLLFPRTGTVEKRGTRRGAQSGQALFTRLEDREALLDDLVAEVPRGVKRILVSSEGFSRLRDGLSPAEYLEPFLGFRRLRVVVVLRRQDDWIESFYKQRVDQFRARETRSLDDYVDSCGSQLLDFHARFTPWRDLVGADSFHALSYDDMPDGASIGRRIIELAGADARLFDSGTEESIQRYDSIRSIDVLGLRILNSYRLKDRRHRNRTARLIYATAPSGNVELMTPGLREDIQARCARGNERIESDWFDHPVPGFRFGGARDGSKYESLSAEDLIAYVDRVMALCEAARREERRTSR